MVGNFLFRSAVKSAALWNAHQRISNKKPEKPMVIIYEYQNKFKAIIK